jgi:hypothetical protein
MTANKCHCELTSEAIQKMDYFVGVASSLITQKKGRLELPAFNKSLLLVW